MNGNDEPIRGVIFDLDGTVYRGAEAVPGAADLIRDLRTRGVQVRFATNRANRPADVVRDQLTSMGLDCDLDDIFTTAEATADVLKPGRYYLIGEAGVGRALENRGFVPDQTAPDYVVVSYDREFSYRKLAIAQRLILDGAQFVATNPDRILSMADGLVPGAGSIVAAVVAATGVDPLVIGKPGRRLFDWALARMGLPATAVIAVGDNLDTDIPAGKAAGMRTMLMLTGVTQRDELARTKTLPTWVAQDYVEARAIFYACGMEGTGG